VGLLPRVPSGRPTPGARPWKQSYFQYWECSAFATEPTAMSNLLTTKK
jgi:hypothetical protein